MYTLINALICSSVDKGVLVEVGKLIFDGQFMPKLGELISGYVEFSVKWPYQKKANKPLDLVDKQLLLIMLKVVSSYFALQQLWNEFYQDHYDQLCIALSQCTQILENNHKVYPSSQYQHLLLDVKPSQFSTGGHTRQMETMSSVYGNISNMLQVLDEHINSLIKERYCMILVSCYENSKVTTFKFKELTSQIQRTILILTEMEKNKNYLKVIPAFDEKVWFSFRLSQ